MRLINLFLTNRKYIFILFLVLAVFASLQSYLGSLITFEDGGRLYTRYNNYLIFKQSFYHLIQGKDLYVHYIQEQWDLYKYSPTFALMFGSLAVLPDVLGLILWNILNAAILYFSVYYLPRIDLRTKGLILMFVVIEMLTSLQSEQSNALMAGLLIFSFGFLERKKYWLASLCLVSTIFIKLFGIVGLAMYLLYPDKLKLTYTTAFWLVLFTFLPIVVVDTDQFLFLYKSWGHLLTNDHSISDGYSVIGWLKTWFNLHVNKTYVSVIGAVIFCIPLLKVKDYASYHFRILILASILIWVVIFNHRAESPTFVIAAIGVALWYFPQVRKKENLPLLIGAFAFTVLASTDVYPQIIRKEIMQPFVVKAVPCILIWVKITYDLLVGPFPESSEENGLNTVRFNARH